MPRHIVIILPRPLPFPGRYFLFVVESRGRCSPILPHLFLGACVRPPTIDTGRDDSLNIHNTLLQTLAAFVFFFCGIPSYDFLFVLSFFPFTHLHRFSFLKLCVF